MFSQSFLGALLMYFVKKFKNQAKVYIYC